MQCLSKKGGGLRIKEEGEGGGGPCNTRRCEGGKGIRERERLGKRRREGGVPYAVEMIIGFWLSLFRCN